MKRFFFFISIIQTVFIGCEEVIQRPIQSKDGPALVVDGIITNENKQQKITLSLPFKDLNGKSMPATGAVVLLIESNSKVYSTQEIPANSGIYFTEAMRAVVGSTYYLHISYKGKDYFASDQAQPVEPLDQLSYRKVKENMYTLNFNNQGQSSNFIYHQINWTKTSYCISANCIGQVFSYDLKSIDAHEIFKPEKAELLFPEGTIIIRKKYSVSEGYKIFLRAILSETEWRGGAFDIDRANAPSNLSSGAIGYFAVSTIVSDSSMVKP